MARYIIKDMVLLAAIWSTNLLAISLSVFCIHIMQKGHLLHALRKLLVAEIILSFVGILVGLLSKNSKEIALISIAFLLSAAISVILYSKGTQ